MSGRAWHIPYPMSYGATACLNLRSWRIISRREDRVRQPLLKRRIVTELLEQFRMVGQQFNEHPLQRLVMLDAGVLLVRVLHRILIGLVRRHFGGDLLGNDL